MRGNEFLEKLELADPAFVAEADGMPVKKRNAWVKWGGLAACVCLLAAVSVLTPLGGPGRTPPSAVTDPGPTAGPAAPAVTDSPAVSGQPDVLRIDLDGIVVNEVDAPVSAARLYFDPALHEDVLWDSRDVADYYGRTLAPAWVPEGLVPSNEDGSAFVILRREDGTPAYDTVWLGWYRQFGTWEDGLPRFTDENNVQHGFRITASKLGQHGCCVYLGPEDQVEWSEIAGTLVSIGYQAMPYGPYDSAAHEPAGYYDMYVAQFTLDGISFQLVAELDVEQNLMFPLLLDYQKPDPKKIDEMLEVLGLSGRRHHLPGELSGGQQQRVAIGRALITRPKLILADEPTGNLDSKNSQDVMELLVRASREYQQTILMITHNRNLSSSVDRVLRVRDGVVTDLGGNADEKLS